MNEKNIAFLAKQLEGIGLENPLGLLIRKICFQPARFILVQKLAKMDGRLIAQFVFERNTAFL